MPNAFKAGAAAMRLLRNIVMDVKYGAFLGGIKRSPFQDQGAYDTVNSDYRILSEIFSACPIGRDDVLVDVGCGRGRVINWWLEQGLGNEIIGIELDEDVASRTRTRLWRHRNVKIITGSVIDNVPPNGTVFYLYNPFDAAVMIRFKQALVETLEDPGSVRIVYYNCEHVVVFEDDPAWNVRCADPVSAANGDRFAIITPRPAVKTGGR